MTTMTVPARFLSKVDKGSECWTWSAGLVPGGYGGFWLDGRWRRAHRVAYELFVGPIPEGLDLDHLCRVRHCVNPAHLEPVTRAENTRRGNAIQAASAVQRAKTHCPRNHPYDEENTYLTPAGARDCRTCRADASRRYIARRRGVL